MKVRNRKRKPSTKGFIIIGAILLLAIPPFAYFRDMRIAYQSVNSGSMVIKTPIGTIEYSTCGTGQPILISHGAGGGFDQGKLISKIIGPGYRFILPSRFGYLRSKTNLPVTPRLQAEAYTYILKDLGISKVSVAAFSAGGPSALSFAAHYPEYCENLMMISAISAPIINSHKDSNKEGAFELLFKSDFLYWVATKVIRSEILSLFGLAQDDQQRLSRTEKQWIKEFFYTTMPASLRAQGNLNDTHMPKPLIRDLESIKAPVLIIHVRKDPLISFQNAEYSHRYIPDSTLITLDGGHYSPGHHREISTKIRDFVHRTQSSRTL